MQLFSRPPYYGRVIWRFLYAYEGVGKPAAGRERGMDRVRALLHTKEVHDAGITGRGVTACVLDSGICLHPDYAARIVSFRDFVNGRTACYDDASHGSHVSGILGGNGRSSGGRYCGIAPDCRLIHLKVLDRYGQGSLADIIEAIQWAIRNRDRFRIRVLNISAGTTKETEEEGARLLVSRVEEAWDAGLVVVAAAGNMGPEPMSITAPGNSRKVITVGSSDALMVRPYRKGDAALRKEQSFGSAYSGCGPTRECICKPEVVAPGTDIVSCSTMWKRGRYYSTKSGTSMAAPAIAGAAALLLESEPGLTNVQVKMRLKEASADLGYPVNRQGWGMPDLRKLLKL